MTPVSITPSRIYLLRHANALSARDGERDFDRALSDEGYGDAEIVADKASDKGYLPDLVLCSTALRCRQTSEAIRRATGPEVEFRYIDQLYNAPVERYLELIQTQDADRAVMLIGHNPAISQTLGALIGEARMSEVLSGGFPTAGLAVIDLEGSIDPTRTTWTLRDFVTA